MLNAPARQLVTRKLAEQLFPALGDHRYISIKLSGCALGDPAASVAGPYLVVLANKKCLETVILSDIIASLDTTQALRSLSTIAASIGMWKGIRSIDISSNALGSPGIAACVALFERQTSLEQIFLANAGLATESARLLVRYLSHSPTTALRVLDFHGNRMESAGLNHISSIVAKSPNLHRLRVSSLGASAQATANLANALSATSALTELDISDNTLDKKGAVAFARVLAQQTHLIRLAFNDLSMTDDALNALLVPLSQAQFPLSHLLLAHNDLTCASADALSYYLESHKSDLRVLNLSGNNLGDLGIQKLAGAIRHSGPESALTKLFIAKNGVCSLPLLQLAQELVKLPSMRCFDVSGNPVSELVIDALHAAFGPGVVVYDAGSDDGIPATEEDEQLQTALQALSDMADVVDRPLLSPEQSSAQSRSTVSRLVSLFSRGTEDSQQSAPSTRIDNVSQANAMDTSSPAETEDADIVSKENDDVITSLSDFETPRVQKRGNRRSMMAISETSVPYPSPGATAGVSSSANRTVPMSVMVQNSTVQNENITQSAQKLKESVARLNKELADAAGELQLNDFASERSTVYSRRAELGDEEDLNRYLLVPSLPQDIQKVSALDFLADVVGAFLMAIFVVVLVLAVARSQEDSTFAYRLV